MWFIYHNQNKNLSQVWTLNKWMKLHNLWEEEIFQERKKKKLLYELNEKEGNKDLD